MAERLGELLGEPVAFGDAARPACGCSRTCGSTRARRQNDPGFAAELADQADVYVNDAFGAAHRAHASTEGVAHLLPAAAGLLLQAELDAFAAAAGRARRIRSWW